MSAYKGSDTQSRRSSTASKQRDESPSRQQSETPRSPRTARGRQNKIYRTPVTPPPEDRMEMEKGFVLDSRAVSSISFDYSKTNPKLGPVLPPYNSQRDFHSRNYFGYHDVDRTLKRTGQFSRQGTSIEGPVADRFYAQGPGFQYLSMRNQFGAGHSRETIDGHGQFMEGIKPVTGYNGRYGFRRNTPWLRHMPSPFGTTTFSSTH